MYCVYPASLAPSSSKRRAYLHIKLLAVSRPLLVGIIKQPKAAASEMKNEEEAASRHVQSDVNFREQKKNSMIRASDGDTFNRSLV